MDVPILGKDASRHEPLSDFVLLKRIENDLSITSGNAAGKGKGKGIHRPEIAQVQSNKGRVVAVGEGRVIGEKIVPIPLSPGDTVLFSKYGAEDILLDGDEYLLIRYDEIKLREKRIIG